MGPFTVHLPKCSRDSYYLFFTLPLVVHLSAALTVAPFAGTSIPTVAPTVTPFAGTSIPTVGPAVTSIAGTSTPTVGLTVTPIAGTSTPIVGSTVTTIAGTSTPTVGPTVTPIPIPGTPTPTVPPIVNPLSPGIMIYPQELYEGTPTFSPVPSVLMWSSVPIPSLGSFSIQGAWVAMLIPHPPYMLIFWGSCPKEYDLPLEAQSLSIMDIQATSCSPPCSSSSICQSDGTCACLPGSTGQSCEDCKPGYYGPSCLSCGGCEHPGQCDDGISGSGCYTAVANTTNTNSCNCLNGQCDSNGQCHCNPGWTAASNGTACAQCGSGFYLNANGDCKVCYPGCIECAKGDGICLSCQLGLEPNGNDKRRCLPPSQYTDTCPLASGTYYNYNLNNSSAPCPFGPSGNNQTCCSCPSTCSACTGPSMSTCTECTAPTTLFNGACVHTNSTSGVCDGSNGSMVVDISKQECDICPAKCTTCKIPTSTSTIDQLKCTGCIFGYFLSNGTCTGSCPVGTLPSPQDNMTCTACSPSCASCKGTYDTCVTCKSPLLIYDGKCISTCPNGLFASNGTCSICHPDCAECSGPSFNQCTSCPWSHPVLTSGRCLRFCSPSQYWNSTTLSCQNCHHICLTCLGSGPQQCLSCSTGSALSGGECMLGDYING